MSQNESMCVCPVASGLCDDLSCKTADRPMSPFSPETLALLRKHFWTDFSDLIPAMAWDDQGDVTY